MIAITSKNKFTHVNMKERFEAQLNHSIALSTQVTKYDFDYQTVKNLVTTNGGAIKNEEGIYSTDHIAGNFDVYLSDTFCALVHAAPGLMRVYKNVEFPQYVTHLRDIFPDRCFHSNFARQMGLLPTKWIGFDDVSIEVYDDVLLSNIDADHYIYNDIALTAVVGLKYSAVPWLTYPTSFVAARSIRKLIDGDPRSGLMTGVKGNSNKGVFLDRISVLSVRQFRKDLAAGLYPDIPKGCTSFLAPVSQSLTTQGFPTYLSQSMDDQVYAAVYIGSQAIDSLCTDLNLGRFDTCWGYLSSNEALLALNEFLAALNKQTTKVFKDFSEKSRVEAEDWLLKATAYAKNSSKEITDEMLNELKSEPAFSETNFSNSVESVVGFLDLRDPNPIPLGASDSEQQTIYGETIMTNIGQYGIDFKEEDFGKVDSNLTFKAIIPFLSKSKKAIDEVIREKATQMFSKVKTLATQMAKVSEILLPQDMTQVFTGKKSVPHANHYGISDAGVISTEAGSRWGITNFKAYKGDDNDLLMEVDIKTHFASGVFAVHGVDKSRDIAKYILVTLFDGFGDIKYRCEGEPCPPHDTSLKKKNQILYWCSAIIPILPLIYWIFNVRFDKISCACSRKHHNVKPSGLLGKDWCDVRSHIFTAYFKIPSFFEAQINRFGFQPGNNETLNQVLARLMVVMQNLAFETCLPILESKLKFIEQINFELPYVQTSNGSYLDAKTASYVTRMLMGTHQDIIAAIEITENSSSLQSSENRARILSVLRRMATGLQNAGAISNNIKLTRWNESSFANLQTVESPEVYPLVSLGVM